MSLSFDQKEDLRLRMMELEKKLAESEEERCKLEKTCNVLMRAFREEEKMHYKALNKKYEKFLEDCTMRRRRNDIILRSLCRIEDRARALFAKTERLKVLKDRYISHLKISDFQKDEKPSLAWKNFQYSSRKITHDVTPKAVHWKSPYISDVMADHEAREFVKPEETSFYDSADGNLYKSFRENRADFFENVPAPRKPLEESDDNVDYEKMRHRAPSEDRLYTFERRETFKNNHKPQFENSRRFDIDDINDSIADENKNVTKDLIRLGREINHTEVLNNQPGEKDETKTRREKDAEETRREKIAAEIRREKVEAEIRREQIAAETWREKVAAETKREKDAAETRREKVAVEARRERDEAEARREKVALAHQESIERLRKALSIEDDESDNLEEGQEKIIEKDNFEMNEKNSTQERNLKSINEDFNRLVISDGDVNNQPDHSDEIAEPKNLPVGLDGIDYQNETYPESYYEQPVHQNHTSIASDVILEEDETEEETDLSDEGAKNPSIPKMEDNQDTGEPKPDKHVVTSDEETEKFSTHEEEFIKMDTTGFDEQSKKSDSPKSENNKRLPQSTLLHLLESDSESFQIEHPDVAAGNEDSDFDFSFNKP